VIGWHILLPAFTVGLGSFIAVLEGLRLATARDVYARISVLWIKIFSIAFGMGVVTGVVMPFQLGTNWSRYADATANVLSPLFAYEDLTAFFLEAAFLGVLLFGRKLVPPWTYFASALMVALGTLFSSFWILAANSWMQTPAGYEVANGQFFSTDWLSVIFSPSFPYRWRMSLSASSSPPASLCSEWAPISSGEIPMREKAARCCRWRSATDGSRPIADGAWRSSRPQHARKSASQARGHRSALGYWAARAADLVRHSERRRKETIPPSRFPGWAA
jgi:bd-type cytochrome oxidase subunit I